MENTIKLKQDYFFCYTKQLAHYLRYEKKIEYVSKTRHLRSGKILTIFEQSKELQQAIDEYNKVTR